MVRHFPGLRTVRRAWSDDTMRTYRGPVTPHQPIHQVIVVGAIGPGKGYEVLLACARDAAERDLPIYFNIVSFTTDDRTLLETGRAVITGLYEEVECQSVLKTIGRGLGFLSSVWPETWCYALSALFEADLDVLAFNIGTQAELISKTKRGFLVPLGRSPAAINEAILG